ncbi:MAG: ACP S-malonyltransferase [Acidimicrobiales bacterium]
MIAYTYPGQGSQAPGMGAPWRNHPSWELVDEASEACGRDIGRLLLEADIEELTETRNAQLATFVTSMVVFDAVTRTGVTANAHAGHSLGEYTALTAAGVLDYADGVRLVAERGEAMQMAADERTGTMAAILGADDRHVEDACDSAEGEVWVANYNAPGQVVVAGDPDDVEAAGRIARERGAKRVVSLQVGGAFHTPFMQPASDRLAKALAITDFREPDHPVYANVDASPYQGVAEWSDLLARQLVSPVRWRHTIHRLADDGFSTLVELGPGGALRGMAKRAAREMTSLSVNAPADIDALLEAIGGTPHDARHHEGEMLHATERLVVSPCGGVFTPVDDCPDGSVIAAGRIIGHVAGTEVRSPFAGELMGYLALADERVTPSQPIAWLRTV